MYSGRFYTGIGSRETPQDVLNDMNILGSYLARTHTLRSGGARGADSAFEQGCDAANGQKEIYIPWPGFNSRMGLFAPEGSMDIAMQFHPAWHKCTDGAKKLHARNVPQVVGKDLDTPSEFLICWTKHGKLMGGTALAMRVAIHCRIPIFNLAIESEREKLVKLVESL